MAQLGEEGRLRVEDLVQSRLRGGRADGRRASNCRGEHLPLFEKFRMAYGWIAGKAIHAPARDPGLERPWSSGPTKGRSNCGRRPVVSFILLPLLNLLTSRTAPDRRCAPVEVRPPSTLMALFAGSTPEEVRQPVQHGHPQARLGRPSGRPSPGALVEARESSEVCVSWRGLDHPAGQDYRRVHPDPDQVMVRALVAYGRGYAEMYEQVVHCGPSAWFLTANDDGGGGTFPVIEALTDRIDVVVRGTPFHASDSTRLVDLVVAARSPEESVPAELVFSPAELDEANRQARAVPMPAEVRDAHRGSCSVSLTLPPGVRSHRGPDRGHTAPLQALGGFTCGNEDCPLDRHVNLQRPNRERVSARVSSVDSLRAGPGRFRAALPSGLTISRAVSHLGAARETPAEPARPRFSRSPSTTAGRSIGRPGFGSFSTERLDQHAAYGPSRQRIVELRAESGGCGADGTPSPKLKTRQDRVRR